MLVINVCLVCGVVVVLAIAGDRHDAIPTTILGGNGVLQIAIHGYLLHKNSEDLHGLTPMPL